MFAAPSAPPSPGGPRRREPSPYRPRRVATRVDHGHFGAAPFRPFQAGPVVLVILADELGVKARQAAHVDAHTNPGRSVAVVFGNVEDDAAAAHLQLERQAGFEAVLRIRAEAEKTR